MNINNLKNYYVEYFSVHYANLNIVLNIVFNTQEMAKYNRDIFHS